jgi:hypothetical protein
MPAVPPLRKTLGGVSPAHSLSQPMQIVVYLQ